MEKLKRLPISFFEKTRPNAPKNSLDDVIPIKWSKEVMNGKKKVKVSLPKNRRHMNKQLKIGNIIVINQ